MPTTIAVKTKHGGKHQVASYANGKLAIWKRHASGGVFSQLPARQVPTLKQAKRIVQSIYFNETVI